MTNTIYYLSGKLNFTNKTVRYVGKTNRSVHTRFHEHVLQKTRYGKNHKNIKIIYFESWETPILQLVPLTTKADCEKTLKRIVQTNKFGVEHNVSKQIRNKKHR